MTKRLLYAFHTKHSIFFGVSIAWKAPLFCSRIPPLNIWLISYLILHIDSTTQTPTTQFGSMTDKIHVTSVIQFSILYFLISETRMQPLKHWFGNLIGNCQKFRAQFQTISHEYFIWHTLVSVLCFTFHSMWEMFRYYRLKSDTKPLNDTFLQYWARFLIRFWNKLPILNAAYEIW